MDRNGEGGGKARRAGRNRQGEGGQKGKRISGRDERSED